ncbi:uncharacterized protein [Odocoileus virginianus]|uniref:Uncharacterized protein n=1 Tax=Odocoileus virginianus TaxID=9874 RepID=A0ABM4HBU8_ODOVR
MALSSGESFPQLIYFLGKVLRSVAKLSGPGPGVPRPPTARSSPHPALSSPPPTTRPPIRAPPPRSPAPAQTSTRALRTPEVNPSLPPRPRAPPPDPRAAGSKVNTKERRRPDGAAADSPSRSPGRV